MYVITGGTGNVGSATATELLRRGEPVTVVTRNPDAVAPWRARGATVAVVDVMDVSALHDVFRSGTRALVLNPPADPAGDTDAAEHRTVAAILAALEGAGLEKIVAVSTYGVRRGAGVGDLGTLERLEAGLAALDVPTAVNRHAYSMTNWAGLVDVVRGTGTLQTVLPADLVLPMVAPTDLGRAAAERLLAPLSDTGVRNVEGPERYTPTDVAAAFAKTLGRPVGVRTTPADVLEHTFEALGFSRAAAASYAGMTRITIAGADLPTEPWRGTTTLRTYVESLVRPR